MINLPTLSPLTLQIKNQAFQLGFDLCSFTAPRISDLDKKAYQEWVASGYGAQMNYMVGDPERRLDIQKAYPGVKTVMTLGVSYFQGPFPDKPGPAFGRVARYAWGEDYHPVILNRLQQLLLLIRDILGADTKVELAVDSKPLLERSLARSAGIGFIGKNTVLISPQGLPGQFHMGSWIFLAEVLIWARGQGARGQTPMLLGSDPLPPDVKSGCGGCTKCLTACPTDAFEGPFKLKSEKCISYLTIENKGWIPLDMRSQMGDWVFGCDVCQDVCPFNARAFETRWPEFKSDRGVGAWISLKEVLGIPDNQVFKTKWGHTPLSRAKRKGLIRNACVAAGNSGDPSLLSNLNPLLEDSEPMVRGHAAWAISKLEEKKKFINKFEKMIHTDPDPSVRKELKNICQMIHEI